MNSQALRIFAFAGPSGSGKTELVRALKRHAPDEVTFWQQVTTRAQRGPDDTDYLFIDEEQFKSVRHILTCTTFFDGKYYGTFPALQEDGTADTSSAVLTIVDATGLASLTSDVLDQNRNGDGKFGPGVRVELYPVLLTYEITPESVQKRAGNRQRSVEHVRQELERLLDMVDGKWHRVSDSSHDWPDVAHFYDAVIRREPVPVAEETPATVRERLAQCSTRIMGVSVQCAPDGSPDATEIRDIIDSLVDILADVEGDTSAKFASGHRSVVREVPDFGDGELLERLETRTAEEPAAEEPAAEEPAGDFAPTLSPRDILGMTDFEYWILDEGVGADAFKNEYSFKVAFCQYLSSNGGNPNGVTVSSQATHDARGGRVIEYVAHVNGTACYAVEYSERLRRIVGHGVR